jgi:hypothetical protein
MQSLFLIIAVVVESGTCGIMGRVCFGVLTSNFWLSRDTRSPGFIPIMRQSIALGSRAHNILRTDRESKSGFVMDRVYFVSKPQLLHFMSQAIEHL